MEKNCESNWKECEQDNYFSYHILVTYLCDKEPKYHVVKNPVGNG